MTIVTSRFSTGICLLLSLAVVAPLNAQPNPPKVQDRATNPDNAAALAKINKALDAFDAEIAELETAAERDSNTIDEYADQLSAEFIGNVSRLEASRGAVADEVGNQTLADLRYRQKMISLYLWELQRVKPFVGTIDHGPSSISIRIHRVFSESRLLAQGEPALMKRYQELIQRVSQLSGGARRRIRAGNRMYHDGRFHLITPGEEIATPDQTEAASFAAGPIQRVRRPLQRILKLKWNGPAIQLDRDHWDDAFAGKSMTSVAEDIQAELKRRGVKLPTNAALPHGVSQGNVVALLFQNMHYQAQKGTANRGGERSERGGGDVWRAGFATEDLSARLLTDGANVEIEIREMAAPKRGLTFEQHERYGLLLDSKRNPYVHFYQAPDGHVQLNGVYDDQPVAISADSFAELYTKYPDVIEGGLFPFLNHLGVLLPPTRFDPEVVKLVLDQLGGIATPTEDDFKQLLEKMDSPSYEIRDAATSELAANLSRYEQHVTNAYQLQDVSLEVKTRLKRVLQSYKAEGNRLDDFVAEMKLTDDPVYLTNLLSKVQASDRPSIVTRLEALTGESLGQDPQAWQSWLQQQAEEE